MITKKIDFIYLLFWHSSLNQIRNKLAWRALGPMVTSWYYHYNFDLHIDFCSCMVSHHVQGKKHICMFPNDPICRVRGQAACYSVKKFGQNNAKSFCWNIVKFVGNKFSHFVSTYKWAKCWSQRRAQQKWCCKWHFFNETFTKWSMSLNNLVFAFIMWPP